MQERTAIAACPLQLRGSPAEFESQTWIDEQGLVMYHYMKRRTNKRLNSTSYCTWRRPSTAQRWPPPPPSRRPPPAHKEFQSPFHNCDIRWLHHQIVDRFPPWSWLECLVCCVAIVWSGGAKISDEKCNLLGKTWSYCQVWKSLLVIWYRSAILCFG